MLEKDMVNRIRAIFLHERPHVSISEATVMLGWSRREMANAIAAGEIVVESAPDGRRLRREELMAKGMEMWSPEAIEEALGADAATVLPESIRLLDIHLRLPRHHVAMLEHLAQQARTTVSAVVAQELDGIASAHIYELSRALPGFAEALAWPDVDRGELPCRECAAHDTAR